MSPSAWTPSWGACDLSPPTLEDRGVGSPAIVKASSVHLLLYGGQIALGFDYAAGQHVAADMS